MNILQIQHTNNSPAIRLNDETKELELIGRSCPENAIEFYQKVYNTVNQYFSSNESLKLVMALEYFNTSSSKCLYQLVKQIKNYSDRGKEVSFKWLYESDDDDMLETGEDFADLLNIQIEFVETDRIGQLLN